MTLNDLEALPCEFIPIKIVSQYLRSKPEAVREHIRKGVPWGYVLGKTAFKIPKLRFIAYHRGHECK